MSYTLIQKFKTIAGNDPVFSVRVALSPLFLVLNWQDQEMKHPLPIFCITKDRDSYLAVNEKEYISVAVDTFRRYFNNEISVEKLQDDYETFEKNAENLYREITDKNLDEFSDQQLQDLANTLNNLFVELTRKTLYVENVDYDILLGVIGADRKAELDAIWEKATEAQFISFDGRRLKKQLDIINEGSDVMIRKAKFMFTDYFWSKSDQEIFTALEDIKSKLSEKTTEYEQLKAEADERSQHHAEWMQTLDPYSRNIAELAQFLMHMRDLRKDPLAQIQALLAELSVVMLTRANIDPKYAPYVLIYEYMKGVEYLESIKGEIEQRKNGCMYIAHPDFTCETELCDFENAVAELTEFLESKVEKNETLTGQIACKGNVKGTVRVIVDPTDDKGFQQGDILVTSMTRPEFVPIMKMAGAVITNEGGITCHAAIISRELKIPCIIGTKVATQVLKDGDMVEVDANHGIIKILL